MSVDLERVHQEGAPLIDGEQVTFVWQGDTAPVLVGDFNSWGWGEPAAQLQATGPDLWTYTTTLPRDAYIEYSYSQDGMRIADPLNSHAIGDGMGGSNSYFFMPEMQETSLLKSVRGIPKGTVTRTLLTSEHLIVGGKRTVHLYAPPVDEPCPLLVVLDGQDYLRRARVIQMVDNLVAQGRIRPIALALLSHAGQARFVEYCCSDSTLAFLVRVVLPVATERLNLLDLQAHPGAHGIAGASMGGLMSLYAGIRLPEIFGHVLSQSGALGFHVLSVQRHTVLTDLVERGDARPIKIWMDVGRYEPLCEANRLFYNLLQARGYDARYREYNGGHNYTAWRNDLWRGLEALFGTTEEL